MSTPHHSVVALNAQLLRRIDLDPAHLAPTDGKEEHSGSISPVTVTD